MDKLMGEGINVYSTLNVDARRHYEIDKYMTIGPFRIYAFPLCHDVPCAGFIVMHDSESLLFCTDTGKIPYNFEMPFDIICVEANYYDDVLDYQVQTGRYPDYIAKRIRRFHMRIDDTKEYLQDCCDLSRCREIHLLHMSEVVEKEDVIKDFSKQFFGIQVS
jgi:phosphoribosyl 1,2-cyclic phosphodiesterase